MVIYKTLVSSRNDDVNNTNGPIKDDINHDVSKYLVYSAGCIIPALDPFADDVMQLIEHNEFPTCSERLPLTFVESVSDAFYLRVNLTLLPLYNRNASIDSCCFQRIDRAGQNAKADFDIRLGHCKSLPLDGNGTATLPPGFEFVLVHCKSGTQMMYVNAHAVVRQRVDIRRRLDAFAEKSRQRTAETQKTRNEDTNVRPLSVLMLAIDSVSRLNLYRTMPQTARFLNANEWFELQGYNKVRTLVYKVRTKSIRRCITVYLLDRR